MNHSPSRQNQAEMREEESALLSSHEHDNTPEPEPESGRGSLAPAWQIWRRLFQHTGDDGLPSPTSTTKRQAKRPYDHIPLYAALILIGVGVGVLFSRGVQRRSRGEGLGDGPMVVPIFQLPPVRCP